MDAIKKFPCHCYQRLTSFRNFAHRSTNAIEKVIFPRVDCRFWAPLCYTCRMPEKIALVTGASSGFGLLTSLELARAGFHVVATMRNLERRILLDQSIASAGTDAKVDVLELDVTKLDAIQAFVNGIAEKFGHL